MKENKPEFIVILGATGIGKSSLGIQLAQCLQGEIISGDSMQVYRGMDIGTGKVTSEEQRLIPHHLIDIRSPNEEYSVVDFCKEAEIAMEAIQSRGKIPIIVGGTGLYIQAFLENYQFSEIGHQKSFRMELEEQEERDPGSLYVTLCGKDAALAKEIEPQNLRRVIRALETLEFGSSLSREKKSDRVSKAWVLGLRGERGWMYERINQRVDEMARLGWERECQNLWDEYGETLSANALQAIGYQEIFRMVEKKQSVDQNCLDEIKQRTRRFAKRQVTWFKRMPYIEWLDIDSSINWSFLTNQLFRNFTK